MNADLALGFLEKPYVLCKADSGAIRFKVRCSRAKPHLILYNKECPHEVLYQIYLSHKSSLILKTGENIDFRIPGFNYGTHDLWLTWYNDKIRLGRLNEPPMLQYNEENRNEEKKIGFIHFKTKYSGNGVVKWEFECMLAKPLSTIHTPLQAPKKVEGGKLRWVKMRKGDVLPIDAMVGGLEMEPIYVARANHGGSICPGKYVKSRELAFIPWGQYSFPKEEFEVLCGYDARWVKCVRNHIPENALIGGRSEVRNEPLYIGRAMIHNSLVPGKVHMLYKTCYLPFMGREVERSEYEILVSTHRQPIGQSCDSLCYTSMIMQPCI